MKPLTALTGRGMPLARADVDTDQIIPAAWLKKTTRTGYGEGLFSQWRQDPSFITNRPERRGATILVAGPNFGCGSSREHAAWALRDFGFTAVVAPGFGDIFRNNLPNAGLVPAQVSADVAESLLRATTRDPYAEIMIDVVGRTLGCPAAGVAGAPFRLDDLAHHRLVNGLELLDLALSLGPSISAYERARAPWLPVGQAGSPGAGSPSRTGAVKAEGTEGT
ncbi:3-isopropylmalate dehydratase small subunit [Streptomyces inusitatus]|uniref:3-isopropylmalate dehydratase small subunit n=1 Tax=Streptomyces inusitatus TaxID=68221 RepID=A0A918QAM7_9ACTN|nr:3-isopropylmalate dehydratase small subunit [Streptomyces inusitatus]GGZ38228.1 3-isopropylmalate dehydratase small subunit [Streptomyces inusitatus]